MLSLSAFTLAPSTLDHVSSRIATQIPATGCFPGNAVWTWVSPDKYFQAWIGPLEYTPNKHFNFHVSTVCGPDTANYHISYNGNHLWKSWDSVSNTTAYYGDSRADLCSSIVTAANDQAQAASNHVYSGDAQDLINKSWHPLWRSMDNEIGGIC
jgi:hypothetical protein